MKYESVVRAPGGTGERLVKVSDISVPDVRSLHGVVFHGRRTEILRLYEDVTTLLGCIRAGSNMPETIFIPDLWHAAMEMPQDQQAVVLELWQLAHDLVRSTEYEVNVSVPAPLLIDGTQYVRSHMDRIGQTVFLSHQSKDKSVVKKTANYLKQHMDIILDEWSFRPGRTLTTEIEQGIKRSTAMVLFWSKSAAASQYVQFEDELAIARQIKDDQFSIQLVRLDATNLPSRYDRLLYHDWQRGRPGTKLFNVHLLRLSLAINGIAPGEL